jgi:putative transposase
VQQARRINKQLGVRKLYAIKKEAIHLINKRIGRDKLFALLGRHGLLIRRRRKYACTTQSKHRFRKYDNKFKSLVIGRPHQAWVGDITYVRIRSGFAYLFLLTDAYSRKIVGWTLSTSLGIEGARKAAQMAIRQCPDLRGLIHHSDRGLQYCAPSYVRAMEAKGVQISMGEAGNCYDNAMAERVNGILKQEYNLEATFADFKEALKSAKEAVRDYNENRPHWSLQLQVPSVVHAA